MEDQRQTPGGRRECDGCVKEEFLTVLKEVREMTGSNVWRDRLLMLLLGGALTGAVFSVPHLNHFSNMKAEVKYSSKELRRLGVVYKNVEESVGNIETSHNHQNQVFADRLVPAVELLVEKLENLDDNQ